MAFPFFTEDEQPTMANFNEKFQSLLDHVDEKAKIVTGTFTGAVSSGSQSVYIGFKPKLFISKGQTAYQVGVGSDRREYYGFILGLGSVLYGVSYGSGSTTGALGFSTYAGTITNTGVAISASDYFNHTGIVYDYIAIG